MLEGIVKKRCCKRQSAIVGNKAESSLNHFLSSSEPPEPGIAILRLVNLTILYVMVSLLQGCASSQKADDIMLTAESCERITIQIKRDRDIKEVTGTP